MKAKLIDKFYGIFLVALFAAVAIIIANTAALQALAISPLLIGIVLGLLFAHLLRQFMPPSWSTGIVFAAKPILRLAIVLYGFRITFQQITAIGSQGLLLSVIMLSSTMLIGVFVGTQWLKLDKHSAILIASGSAVCGAAAVLATEDVLKSAPHKTAIAIATVVIFGTISMFLYPIMYKSGLLNMDLNQFGLYVGASVHEVAQVVAASGSIDSQAADTAIIVKMSRVLLLAPMLLIIGWLVIRASTKHALQQNTAPIPWFAVLFIAVAGFNSLNFVPIQLLAQINQFDTFLLTMAMTALGMETHLRQFKQAGLKPFLLALIIFLWLVFAGYALTLTISH